MPLWILGAVVGVALVGAGLYLLFARPGTPRVAAAPSSPQPTAVPAPPAARLVAAIPFSSPSDRQDLAAFAAATTALARRHLFCVRALSVLSAEDTPGADENEVRELFTKQGREAILAGRIEETADGLVVEAQAQRVSSSRPLGPYRGTFDDLASIAERMAADFAAAVGVTPTPDEVRAIESCRPGKPTSMMRLGMAMTVGQVGRATELLEQAIAEDRTFALLYAELAHVVGDLNPDRGAALLEEATKLDPAHAVPYWQLAMLWIFRFSGKSSAALAMTEQSIARAPAFGQARILHGNFLGLLGSPEEAAARRIAIQLLPGSAPAWANQGKVLAKAGDAAGAVTAFEKALALDAASADALEGLPPAARTIGNHPLALRWAEKRMDAENPRTTRFGEEAPGDETKFFAAVEDALAAAQAMGDRAAVERIAKKALAVSDDFKPAKKALGR